MTFPVFSRILSKYVLILSKEILYLFLYYAYFNYIGIRREGQGRAPKSLEENTCFFIIRRNNYYKHKRNLQKLKKRKRMISVILLRIY